MFLFVALRCYQPVGRVSLLDHFTCLCDFVTFHHQTLCSVCGWEFPWLDMRFFPVCISLTAVWWALLTRRERRELNDGDALSLNPLFRCSLLHLRCEWEWMSAPHHRHHPLSPLTISPNNLLDDPLLTGQRVIMVVLGLWGMLLCFATDGFFFRPDQTTHRDEAKLVSPLSSVPHINACNRTLVANIQLWHP